jgi:hypothetical protein
MKGNADTALRREVGTIARPTTKVVNATALIVAAYSGNGEHADASTSATRPHFSARREPLAVA